MPSHGRSAHEAERFWVGSLGTMTLLVGSFLSLRRPRCHNLGFSFKCHLLCFLTWFDLLASSELYVMLSKDRKDANSSEMR